jgi:amino acid permease
MCGIMFNNTYGAMVSYLLIIKEMLPVLLGIVPSDEPMKRAVMVIATLLVIFPLSSQRDMADLTKLLASVSFVICALYFLWQYAAL